MAAVLALLSAVCFALSAALQRRGEVALASGQLAPALAAVIMSTDAPRADPAHA